MERPIKYKTVSVVYILENGILDNEPDCTFKITEKSNLFTVTIKQAVIRIITITADEPVFYDNLILVLSKLERLLFIFDGIFFKVVKAEFTDAEDIGSDRLNEIIQGDNAILNEQFFVKRLKYYQSSDVCSFRDKLVNYDKVLTTKLYADWGTLLDELDIVNQVYLYSMAETGMPVDVRLAFLVEMAEPMVELLHSRGCKLSGIRFNEKQEYQPSLKQCIQVLIKSYGEKVFNKEMSEQSINTIYSRAKASRVRIMHIKRNQEPGEYFNGVQSVYYIMKFSVQYRNILLNLLKIDNRLYQERLEKIINRIDRWFDDNYHKQLL